MRMPKAKRCPFCASPDGFVERMTLSDRQYVCNNCFAHGPSVEEGANDHDDQKTDAAAIRAWNRRQRYHVKPTPDG